MGNPNVGKSVLFSRLTGAHVVASNYPGTTVEFTRGRMRIDSEWVEIIDVPGTYTLQPNSRAEEVAVKMLQEGDLIIDVVDATTLERNLNLTLQLIGSGKPVVVALNLFDEAEHTGIKIDVPQLEQELGVPVVPTCALTGEGVGTLVKRFDDAKGNFLTHDSEKVWARVGEIISAVQQVTHRHHTFLELLGDASVHPFSGAIIALIVALVAFWLIRTVGEGLIGFVMEPVFEGLWQPVMIRFSEWLGSEGLFHDLLIGTLIEGEIDFVQSFGLLTTGLFVPIAMVLPYVLAFYAVLGLLEDIGYLPRLGVLMDTVMHRLGIHGLSVVPMLLALGCNVPGALATRIMDTRKERVITAALMVIAVPCMAQSAVIFSLLGPYGIKGFLPVFLTLPVLWIVLGSALNFAIQGESPEMLIEIPPYRVPDWRTLLKKLWVRVRQFLAEAVPFVLLGVLVVNLLYTLSIVGFLGRITSPIISGVLGLPEESTAAIVVGFLRKDVAVGMLAPLNLDLRQLIVACVMLTVTFPCAATFVVLLRELGWKDMALVSGIMVFAALVLGGTLNVLLRLIY